VKIVKGVLVAVVIMLSNEVVLSQSNELTKVSRESRNGNPKGYIEYLPPGFDTSGNTKYPILYWLHGLEEIGLGTSEDLDKILNIQICNWLKTNSRDFIILVPQDYNGYWNGTPTRLKTFIDWANGEYGKYINPGQQHVAGLSAGGYGVRSFILENSATYQAIATFTFMSTNVNDINLYAQTIVSNNQYVWFHHGNDDVVPNTVNDVRTLHDRIFAIDSLRSRLTVYTGVGHNAWEMVYNNEGKSAPQVTGVISNTQYYPWNTNDIDADWYAWMKASGKTPVAGDSPTAIKLTNTVIAENNALNGVIGKFKSNGHRPQHLALIPGENDNNLFDIENQQLVAKSVFDFETRAVYTIKVSAANEIGSFTEVFTITVQDIFEEVPVAAETPLTLSRVAVFPNPVTGDHILMTSNHDEVFVNSLELIDTRGQRSTIAINNYVCRGEPFHVQLQHTPGVYFLRINTARGSEVVKIIKTN